MKPRHLPIGSLAALAALALVPPVLAQAPADALAEVKDALCKKGNSSVSVSFRLDGAIGQEDRTSLDSGITVSFVHHIAIYKRRAFFFDRLIGRARIDVSATLDTLTKQYSLFRQVEGEAPVEGTAETFEDVERWLSEVRRIEISVSAEELTESLELRVKSEYRRIFAVYLFPWSLTAEGKKGCR